MKSKILLTICVVGGLLLAGCGEQVCCLDEPAPATCAPCMTDAGSTCNPSCIETYSSSCGQGPCGAGVKLEKMVPTEVRNNMPFEYKIKVTNTTNETLTNVVVEDNIPQNLRFESSMPPMTSMEGGVARWELGTLQCNDCVVINVNAVAEGEGCITSCAKLHYESPVCAMMNIVEAKLRLSKVAPSCKLSCDRIPLTYIITNTGTASACNVTIKDELPEGLVTSDGSRIVTFCIDDLGPCESQEFEVCVDPTSTGNFGSAAIATSSTCDMVESNFASTNVVKPVLDIVQTGPQSQYICKDACYTVTVTNRSDCAAEDAMLTTNVPCNAYRSCNGGGLFDSATGEKITWNVGDLAPGESKTYSFTLTGTQPGVLNAVSTVSAYCAEPVCAESSTVLSGVPAVLMEVVDQCDPIEVGQSETYIITITNQGTAVDTNIQISAMLEDNMQYISSSGPTSAEVQGNKIVFEPLAELCPGAQAVWRVNVKGTAEADSRFKAMMISDQLSRAVEETEATNFYMSTVCGQY